MAISTIAIKGAGGKLRGASDVIRLDKARIELGWSKARLAREAGLNQTTVSLVTNGRLRPGQQQLRDLAVAVGHSGDPLDLLREVDKP